MLEAAKVFQAKREEIYALLADFDDIPKLKRKRLTKFVNGFYATLDSDKSFNSKLVKRCRKVSL